MVELHYSILLKEGGMKLHGEFLHIGPPDKAHVRTALKLAIGKKWGLELGIGDVGFGIGDVGCGIERVECYYFKNGEEIKIE
jgi:hypothetical protein